MADLNFDILSWNVRGLGDYQKRCKLFNWMKKHTSKKHIRLTKQENNGKNCGEDQ